MRHDLKIEQCYLENLMNGTKKSEVRLNDRDYQTGDKLCFYHADTDKDIVFKITHIHSGLGLKEGYVTLSVEKVNYAI